MVKPPQPHWFFSSSKAVLGVGPGTIELAEAEHLGVGVGHQDRILVAGDALAGLAVGFDEGKLLLSIVGIVVRDGGLAQQRPAQHDDTALLPPARQRQFAIQAFPPLAGIGPARLAKQTADVALDVFRQLELEQVRLLALLQREELDAATLPPTWSAIPASHASVKIGSAWLASRRSPILLVPSVVVPEERASLINPNHPESKRITARVVRLFEYNRLFR